MNRTPNDPSPPGPIPRGVDDTPVLVIDEARMDANIAQMSGRVIVADRLLRPHFKTSKMIEVARRQVDAGAIGLTCATFKELDRLVEAGFRDLLWATQPVGATKVRQAIDLNRRARVVLAVDSMSVGRPLSEAAATAGLVLPVLLEVDTGLGRAGVEPGAAVATARDLATLSGLKLIGVMTHEGHLAGYGADRAALERAGRDAATSLVNSAVALADAGFATSVVSVGSTPGATSAPFVDGVTEARPGTYVFFDANQVSLGSATWKDCALHVVARVISRPRSGLAIIDAGIKAMSSDSSVGGHGFGVVDSLEKIRFEVAYEEHGVLTGAGVEVLDVGDLVSIIPNHACGAVNMWSHVGVARDGELSDEWATVGRY